MFSYLALTAMQMLLMLSDIFFIFGPCAADWSPVLIMSSDAPGKGKACRNPDNVIPGIRQFRAERGSDVTVR